MVISTKPMVFDEIRLLTLPFRSRKNTAEVIAAEVWLNGLTGQAQASSLYR